MPKGTSEAINKTADQREARIQKESAWKASTNKRDWQKPAGKTAQALTEQRLVALGIAQARKNTDTTNLEWNNDSRKAANPTPDNHKAQSTYRGAGAG